MKQIFSEDSITIEKIYSGVTFTVVKAIFTNGNGRRMIGEGIARRSFSDAPNPEMGRKIAEGRAIRAISKKLEGKRIRHSLMG